MGRVLHFPLKSHWICSDAGTYNQESWPNLSLLSGAKIGFPFRLPVWNDDSWISSTQNRNNFPQAQAGYPLLPSTLIEWENHLNKKKPRGPAGEPLFLHLGYFWERKNYLMFIASPARWKPKFPQALASWLGQAFEKNHLPCTFPAITISFLIGCNDSPKKNHNQVTHPHEAIFHRIFFFSKKKPWQKKHFPLI